MEEIEGEEGGLQLGGSVGANAEGTENASATERRALINYLVRELKILRAVDPRLPSTQSRSWT